MESNSKWRPGRAALGVGALGVALGVGLGVTGGAHAAGLITGKQIKDNTVTSADVRNGTITGADVRNFSLAPADFDGDVTGPQGPRGEQGVTGRPGLEFAGYAVSPNTEVVKGAVKLAVATCDPGLHAVAGGHYVPNGGSLQLLDSAPAGNPTPQDGRAWVARVKNTSNATAGFIVWAICAEVN